MTTSARFRLVKAGKEDEKRLEQLYTEKSLDGAIQINLDRSPDFFAALSTGGYESLIYAVEDTVTGRFAGAGIRHLRKCYINGKEQTIGYVSGLRIAGEYRKSRALHMIFSQLRQMYLTAECPGYILSVFNSNKKALAALTSAKAGAPLVKPIGEMHTCVFRPKPLPAKAMDNHHIRTAQPKDIPALTAFLNREGATYQFAPSYTEEDFTNASGQLRGLPLQHIYLAFNQSEITGCLALWNQTPFRRWKVEGYSGMLQFLRPALNAFFRIMQLPRLPKKHSNFNYWLLSLTYIKNRDLAVFAGLFNRAIQNPAIEDALISASFFKNSPYLSQFPVLKFTFKSTIFISHWEETQKEIDTMDNRSPYLEAGSL